MKTPLLPRIITPLSFGIATALLASGPLVNAATITQVTNDKAWDVASTWSNNALPSAGNDYFTDASLVTGTEVLRTPSAAAATFNGDSLTIVAGTELLTKNTGAATFTISNLILNGGQVRIGDAQNHNLAGGINVLAASTLFNPGSATRILGINSNLTGAANLTLDGNNATSGTGPGSFVLNSTASTYSGTFIGINNARINFDQSYDFSSLNLNATTNQSQLILDTNLVFQNVTFGATTFAAGTTLTGAQLKAMFPTFVTSSSNDLSTLTVVPEPSTALLLGMGVAGLALVRRRRRA